MLAILPYLTIFFIATLVKCQKKKSASVVEDPSSNVEYSSPSINKKASRRQVANVKPKRKQILARKSKRGGLCTDSTQGRHLDGISASVDTRLQSKSKSKSDERKGSAGLSDREAQGVGSPNSPPREPELEQGLADVIVASPDEAQEFVPFAPIPSNRERQSSEREGNGPRMNKRSQRDGNQQNRKRSHRKKYPKDCYIDDEQTLREVKSNWGEVASMV